MAHPYRNVLFLLGLLAGNLHAQTIYQGGIAGGDYSAQVSEFSLPAELRYFTAELLPGGTTLTRWATSYEADVAYYAVEGSSDGRHFSELGRRAVANAAAGYAYQLEVDAAAPAYYRLRVTEADGRAWYSEVARTAATELAWDFRPLANPQSGHAPQLILSGLAPDRPVSVRVLDPSGRTVHHGYYAAAGQRITLPVRLPPATYVVTMSSNGQPPRTHRLVVAR